MGGNAYEEARNQNIVQNRKKLEEFGLPKTLAEADLQKKPQPQPPPKQRTPKPTDIQLRRSSRPRNSVSYSDDLDIGLPPLPKRSRTNSSSRESSDEFNLASYEERARAIKAAEELQTSLQSQNPSFVKSMVRSHVYSCFWLGLPSEFCKTHLSKSTVEMVLEDGNGKEFAATYIGQRVGLSGGWRAFALEHKLDDGDALVFELIEPTRFKIYITRFSSISSQEHNAKVVNKEVTGAEKTSKGPVNSQSYQTRKSKEANLCGSDDLPSPQEPQPQNGNAKVVNKEVTGAQKTSKGAVNSQSHQTRKSKEANLCGSDDLSSPQEPQPQNGVASEGPSEVVNQSKKNGFISQKVQKKGKLSHAGKSKEVESADKCVSHKPKNRKERLFRKRAW